MKKRLLVDGWTGINHSYAMVNQYQLLELLKDSSIELLRSEAKFHDSRWSRSDLDSGFSPEERLQLEGIPLRDGEPVLAAYKIFSPVSLKPESHRQIAFVVTELGLDRRSLTPDSDVEAFFSSENVVVTPSCWSRDRVVEFGFEPSKVFIIPHGVDSQKFFQFSEEDRLTARASLGYTEEDTVFLNVGAPFWTKGLDILLQAFSILRQSRRSAKLMVKDQEALYGLSSVNMLKSLSDSGHVALDREGVESITVIPKTLTIEQLRALYNIADFYVSPYRAEGFNLPVIEAMACGTKVIVTEGGSTDDFCNARVANKIPSTKFLNALVNESRVGAYLQPDLDALVQLMESSVDCKSESYRNSRDFQFGRTEVLETFTWGRAAKMISALI